MRPARVHARTLRFTHTFGLGGMSTVLVFMLIGTGLLMMFVYEPSPELAWQSIQAMQAEILFGRLVRGIHYWSANLLIAMTLLHMVRVLMTGGFHASRRTNWIIGVALLLLVLTSGFTGYLLPWDQVSYWAVTICAEMLGHVPGIGPQLQSLIIGGAEIGPVTMIRFYALHTTVAPVLLVLLMTWHFWRVRIAGGVVIPNGSSNEPGGESDYVPFIPDLLLRETVAALILVAAVLVLAIGFGAPLGEPANPGLSPNPAKAPWYFLGFQELLLHFHPLFAAFIIPLVALLVLTGMAYLPYGSELSGNWFLTTKGRRMALSAAVVSVIATACWILADEFIIGPEGWLPGASPLVSNGLVPFTVLLAGITGFYLVIKKIFDASRNEAVQALLVLLLAGFTVLTATGVWFRGSGMTLVWPWQM